MVIAEYNFITVFHAYVSQLICVVIAADTKASQDALVIYSEQKRNARHNDKLHAKQRCIGQLNSNTSYQSRKQTAIV